MLSLAVKQVLQVSFQFFSEKFAEFTGTQGEVNSSGYITSPNFPRGYAVRNEVFTYLIENTDPNGLIRLEFNDWNLSPNSRITVNIYLVNISPNSRITVNIYLVYVSNSL